MNYEPQDSHVKAHDWLAGVIIVIFVAAIAAMFGLLLATQTSAHASRTHIPAWLHVTPVHRYRACGGPGVIVYGHDNAPDGDGGSSALICRNGRAFAS